MVMTIRVDEEEEAVPQLIALSSGKRLVRVDGHSGHGKSRVAKAMAAELNWPRIEVDRFLDGQPRGERSYDQMVDLPRLMAALASSPDGAILDGLWLNKLVPLDALGPELRIYVRTYTSPAYDMDERYRQQSLGTDLYHAEYDPHHWADVSIVKLVAD